MPSRTQPGPAVLAVPCLSSALLVLAVIVAALRWLS
jgi:hypothetical protein